MSLPVAARHDLRPTERFSSRVADYLAYRPRYPADLVGLLEQLVGLSPAWIVADVGSGTGFLADLFLEYGNLVYGVEPNAEMRAAAETRLSDTGTFHSVAGRAEDTTLAADLIDLITVGQAFHWFDPMATRVEFRRILRPGGFVALIDNVRRLDTPLLGEYEEFLWRHCPEYGDVARADEIAKDSSGFFTPDSSAVRELDNHQALDWPGLVGRFLSASYAPGPEDPGHATAMEELAQLFQRHARDGVVRLEYKTRISVGRLEN